MSAKSGVSSDALAPITGLTTALQARLGLKDRCVVNRNVVGAILCLLASLKPEHVKGPDKSEATARCDSAGVESACQHVCAWLCVRAASDLFYWLLKCRAVLGSGLVSVDNCVRRGSAQVALRMLCTSATAALLTTAAACVVCRAVPPLRRPWESLHGSAVQRLRRTSWRRYRSSCRTAVWVPRLPPTTRPPLPSTSPSSMCRSPPPVVSRAAGIDERLGCCRCRAEPPRQLSSSVLLASLVPCSPSVASSEPTSSPVGDCAWRTCMTSSFSRLRARQSSPCARGRCMRGGCCWTRRAARFSATCSQRCRCWMRTSSAPCTCRRTIRRSCLVTETARLQPRCVTVCSVSSSALLQSSRRVFH